MCNVQCAVLWSDIIWSDDVDLMWKDVLFLMICAAECELGVVRDCARRRRRVRWALGVRGHAPLFWNHATRLGYFWIRFLSKEWSRRFYFFFRFWWEKSEKMGKWRLRTIWRKLDYWRRNHMCNRFWFGLNWNYPFLIPNSEPNNIFPKWNKPWNGIFNQKKRLSASNFTCTWRKNFD